MPWYMTSGHPSMPAISKRSSAAAAMSSKLPGWGWG
jgi:hypothetical protein